MRIEFRMDEKSIDNLIRSLERNLAEKKVRSGEGLKAIGESILESSFTQVPKETGALAESAYLDGPFYDSGHVWVRIGYGAPGVVNPRTGTPVSEYMVYIHEDLTQVHPDGKPKFLEDPVRDAQRIFADTLAAELRIG